MQIKKKDVFWNFLATFLKTASSIFLLPLILKILPSQDIGLWTIFVSIGTIVTILDFGFGPSFSRNITFIFSGVNKLTSEGFSNEDFNQTINYGLLKSALKAMRFFYLRVASVMFIVLATAGTYYISKVLHNYNGNHTNIYIAWGLFVFQVSFSMYTDYFESLLIGRGYIAASKKITIVSQLVYLILASCLIIGGFGLAGMIAAQLLSVFIIRFMSYRKFYDKQIKTTLANTAIVSDSKEIIKTIYPNAIKGGINSLGSIFIYRAPLLIGSLFLSLKELGSYGLTRQIFDIMYLVASTYSITYFPQFSNNWIKNKVYDNKVLYVKSLYVSLLIYIVMVILFALFANRILLVLNSKTLLLGGWPLLIISLNYLFTLIHGQSVPIIVSRNFLPLYYVGFIGGIFVMLLSYVFLKYFHLEVLGLVIPPAIVYLSYENWKWPFMAFKILELSMQEFVHIFKDVIVSSIKQLKKSKFLAKI